MKPKAGLHCPSGHIVKTASLNCYKGGLLFEEVCKFSLYVFQLKGINSYTRKKYF